MATPGRIYDLADKNVAKLKDCKYLVLDEADKLISIEFQNLIFDIFNFLPKKKQIILVSATFPKNISSFVNSIENVKKVNLMHELTLKGLT